MPNTTKILATRITANIPPGTARLLPYTCEWSRAWSAIAQTFGNTMCHIDGKTWEYIGSEPDARGHWYHIFRHHARGSARQFFRVPATPGWMPASIELAA